MSSCPSGRSTPRTMRETRVRDGRVRIILRMITTSRGVDRAAPHPPHHAADDACRKDNCCCAEPDTFWRRGRRRPGAECDGIDVARRSAGCGERLAKIQRLAQLHDGRLPLTHGGDVGRSAQPSREQLFAEVRAGAREQLEQRGGAEHIEIARIQMIVCEKAGAGLTDAVPSVFETRDAVFVERHRPSGAVERAKDAVVPHGQCDEGENGHGEQPRS